MYKRANPYLIKDNLLYEHQYEFRKKHSTIGAEIKFVSDTLLSFDERKSTIIFLDVSKAFDTDHTGLLNKFERIGIRGTALD